MISCTAIPVTILKETTAISQVMTVPSGKLVGVASTAGAMDSSDTYTVKLVDGYSIQIYSVGSLAESSTVVDFYDTSTETFPMSIPIIGPVTLTVTASAQQDDAAVEYTVYLYIEH